MYHNQLETALETVMMLLTSRAAPGVAGVAVAAGLPPTGGPTGVVGPVISYVVSNCGEIVPRTVTMVLTDGAYAGGVTGVAVIGATGGEQGLAGFVGPAVGYVVGR